MVKVLVIDDSEIIRNLLREYMSELGYEVDFAVDGQQGIDKALSTDYKVIFCDIHMPKKNGYLVFKEIQAVKPETFFIMTDSLPDRLAQKAFDEGAFKILTKPFELADIDNVLSEITTRVTANDHN